MKYTIILKAGLSSKLSYDDPLLGVYDEPFVCNTDEVLWKNGFRPGDSLTFGFSETLEDFPENICLWGELIPGQEQAQLSEGRSYQVGEASIWLCQHLFDYCDCAPKYIYVYQS